MHLIESVQPKSIKPHWSIVIGVPFVTTSNSKIRSKKEARGV